MALCVALLCCPSLAAAQSWFHAGLVAQAVVHAADGVTTWRALQRPGTYEANPAMRWMVKSPVRLTAAKAIGVGAQTVLLRRLHRSHPKWATGIVWGLNGLVAAVAVSNHRAGRGRR